MGRIGDDLDRAWTDVEIVAGLLGGHRLDQLPHALMVMIKNESWKRFRDPLGHEHEHDEFEDFVEADPLDGLGANSQTLRDICAHDVEARDLLDSYIVRDREHGNSRDQALRRLRRSRPDLHARVLKGELSPHAAAVEAGLRTPTATVPIDTAAHAIEALLRRFPREELLMALSTQ